MFTGLSLIKFTSYHVSLTPFLVFNLVMWGFLCCSWILYHLNIFIRICKIMLFWWCCFGFWVASTYLSGYEKYVVIGLLKIYYSNQSDKIILNIICIIFWSIVYMVSIKEEIIQNPPFQFPGPSFVVINVTRNVGFGDTRSVLLIGPYHMCSYNRDERVLKIGISMFWSWNWTYNRRIMNI